MLSQGARASFLGFSLLLVLAPGCGPAWGFTESTFVPELRHYDIAYADIGTRALVENGWLVDNFHRDGAGTYLPIVRGVFATEYAFDVDHDGAVDHHVTRPIYDLRLLHQRDDSVIFVRTIPVDRNLSRRNLQNLARSYVEDVSGTTYFSASFSSRVAGTSRTHATRIISEAPASLDGRNAYDVTFDVVDLDLRELDPTAIANRVRIVIARPNPGHIYPGPSGARLPMLVVTGYAAAPSDFDSHVAELDALLSRFTWRPALQ
jgi:hypothetical protein